MRPPIGIIGAGRAGTALGYVLRRRGWRVEACWSRSQTQAQRAATLLDAVACWGEDLHPVCAPPILLIAVVDDAIEAIAAKIGPLTRADQVALHISGSRPSSALEVPSMRARCGSLHPLQSLVSPQSAEASLKDAFVAIEGHPDAVAVAETLGAALGCRAVRVETTQKTAYHASAVVVSNYLVTLFDAGVSLMQQAGIDEETAREMLLPLAQGTLDNLSHSRPEEALTGPVRRGDAATISRHLQALSVAPRSIGRLYEALLPRTIEIAARGGLSSASVEALRALIDEGEES